MPEVQWLVTASGLFAATLGLCLVAIIAHDALRRRRWIIAGALAVVVGCATLLFTLLVAPSVHVG